jgi:hypothetical protein
VIYSKVIVQTYMKKQDCNSNGDEKEDGQDQVGKDKRKTLEELYVTKDLGILLCRLGEEASETGSDDRTQTPDNGHDGEGTGLKFSLGNHLSNHCSNNTN